MRENWTLSATERRYPWVTPIRFEAALGLSGDDSQSWFRRGDEYRATVPAGSSFSTSSNHHQSWSYFNTCSVSASVGWGRVRNATGIYDALVLEQRLRESGALARPLS